MKDKRPFLLQAGLNKKTLEERYTYIDSFKIRSADTDSMRGYKEAKDNFRTVHKKIAKKEGIICAVGVLIAYAFMFLAAYFDSYDIGPAFIVVGILTLIVSLYVAIQGSRKARQGEEYLSAKKRVQDYEGSIAFTLGLPADAVTVDLVKPVKRIKATGEEGLSLPARLCEYRVYKRDDCLCIGDKTAIYRIPVSKITDFYVYDRYESFNVWEKDKPYTDEAFKPYKIGYNPKASLYSVKNPSVMGFYLFGESFKLVIMPWSTPLFEQILGITATPPEKKE